MSRRTKVKALFLTQSKGFKHGPVTRGKETLAPAEIAMTQLGQQTGLFDVHCTQDCRRRHHEGKSQELRHRDVLHDTGPADQPSRTLEYFINDWLKQKGHGFMGFHSATDTYHNEPLYWEMIGGTFNGHPWGIGSKVTVTVDDPNFPGLASRSATNSRSGRNLPVHALAAREGSPADEPQHGEVQSRRSRTTCRWPG